MTEVKGLVADPWRQLTCGREGMLFADGADAGSRLQIGEQSGGGGVQVATGQPRLTHGKAVPDQCLLVSGPHRRSRMVAPPVARDGKRS